MEGPKTEWRFLFRWKDGLADLHLSARDVRFPRLVAWVSCAVGFFWLGFSLVHGVG